MKFPAGITTIEDRIKYVVANKIDIINLKKSITKNGDCFGVNNFEKSVFDAISKGEQNKGADTGVVSKTIIGNTYNWLDSHDDVHIDGLFTKSINENKSNIMHLHDHLQRLSAKVGIPQNVYEKAVPWVELGVNKSGNTTCLLMDSEVIKDLNPSIYYQYCNKQVNQHSVGMQYVKLFLCVNSMEANYKKEFANWNKYIGFLGNPEKAIDQGYFFAITEAKLKEISCVTKGSNELTGTLDDMEPDETTPKANEPGSSTQPESIFSKFQII